MKRSTAKFRSRNAQFVNKVSTIVWKKACSAENSYVVNRCLGPACDLLELRNATEMSSPSVLSYHPCSALRQQLHIPAMRPLSRLEYERLCGASWSTNFVRIPNVMARLYRSCFPLHSVHCVKAGHISPFSWPD